MLQVKIIFRLFYFFKLVYFFQTWSIILSQPRSICFNLDQFGAGKKHKSQVIVCQYRKYAKHSLKLTLGLIKPKKSF